MDLPIGPVDLMACEEVGAWGVDDEPEEERVSGGDVVIDARIRTADSAQVRPGIVVPGVLVDRGIPDRLVVLVSGMEGLGEREGVFHGFQDRCSVSGE